MIRSFPITFTLVMAITRPTLGADLIADPQTIEFTDSFSGRQLLINDGDRDLTRIVRYSSLDTKIAQVDASGYVTPTGNGATMIEVRRENRTLRVPVTVRGFSEGRAIDFRSEVVPLLSKLGCNAGGCHGKASGQNGFRLSLFGFDTRFDYDAITKEGRGRRIFPAAPDASLFLRKATATVPHGGGKRLVTDSADYRTIRDWIAAGTPSAAAAPRVQRIRVRPSQRVLAAGAEQQLAVIAEYSDGSTRDVTRQSEFFSNLDVVAFVDSTGLVKAGRQSGEAAIMARHMGYVAVFHAMIPHGPPLPEIPEFAPRTVVDKLMVAKWQKLGLRPSPITDDATFLRRATLDLCGRLPTTDEARAFLKDSDPHKRTKLIDRLLDSADYPAYFALKWGSILRNSPHAGAERAAVAFHNWLKDQIARNRPYDEFVRGIVAASGEWQDAPAINWYWQNRDDQLHQTTADVAQLFLGIRLQCAKCHHHPYERWGQADYYGLAGFFTRLGRKNFGEPPPYFVAAKPTTGEHDPLTGKTPEPKFLDGPAAHFSPEDDPRHALVDWLADPKNPFFAKALVNRMWGHFFGRGLFHEVDDQRETNPASNPELLDALAKAFIASKFDVKQLIRLLITSRVYELTSEPTEFNRNDRQNFARYYAKRLPAEVLYDAVNSLTGAKTGFNGAGENARAIDLPHEGFGSYFLDTFDRPKRVTTCECERSTSATLGQVLLLANSEEVENKIAASDGRLAKMIRAKMSTKGILDELYLHAFSRFPTSAEQTRLSAFLDKAGNKTKALEDIVWTLINSKEFLFIR